MESTRGRSQLAASPACTREQILRKGFKRYFRVSGGAPVAVLSSLVSFVTCYFVTAALSFDYRHSRVFLLSLLISKQQPFKRFHRSRTFNMSHLCDRYTVHRPTCE